jgi:adenosylmethionine-8-amino-7-oxononanoate aminotransferase
MAAALATPVVFESFLGPHYQGRTFQHGHTYGGNPLAAAAALASLDLLEDGRVLEQELPRKIQRLTAALAALAEHPHVGQVRQLGMMAGVELVEDRATNRPFPSADRRGWEVCRHSIASGVWLRPLGDVVVVMPPLTVSDSELELLARVLGASIDAVCRGHVNARPPLAAAR